MQSMNDQANGHSDGFTEGCGEGGVRTKALATPLAKGGAVGVQFFWIWQGNCQTKIK